MERLDITSLEEKNNNILLDEEKEWRIKNLALWIETYD